MAAYPMYQIEVRHERLHKYRLIRGTDKYVVEQKASAQVRAWDEMCERKQAIDSARKDRERAAQEKESKKVLAQEQTAEARQALADIENTLKHTLDVNDRIEWDSLLDRSGFPEPLPTPPKFINEPPEPLESNFKYKPIHKWFHRFMQKLREKAIKEARDRFVTDRANWERAINDIKIRNEKIAEAHTQEKEQWESERIIYEKKRAEKNVQILEKKASYLDGDPQAILEYCDMVLSNSQYPDSFPQEWNLDYQSETKTIVVDYFLPSPEDLPTLKEVRYVASKDDFNEINVNESELNRMYDSLLYQISLRTIHEIFESDQINSIQAVVFNGWVRTIDRGTGKKITVCVLSLQSQKQEIKDLNLENIIDYRACFRALKGVGSSKLHGLTPVAPILQLNREDKRFVSSYSVVGEVDHSTNIAAMDWEDFEHLIRELFEKEFSQNGGEVKITQASRDGGVDAVAFDPDPIRGGKIVIQAKRYTATVGVSAVRDLYGTVMNEGATKGILVTTADYGPDAYSFAKGKPLTLLNGANLLHLLEKHGHKAKIDLKEAKQILADNKKEEISNP